MEKKCGANRNCKNPAVPGRKLCEAHAERRRFCRRRLDAGRKASGLCKRCLLPREDMSMAHCSQCLKNYRLQRAEVVAAENVLLDACGDTPAEPATETPKRSQPNYKRIRIEKRKALGLCIRCGKAPNEQNLRTCNACREEKNQERRETRARRASRVRNAAKVILEQHPDILDASPEGLRLMRMKREGDEDDA
ncbi:hypothetical protein ANO14919_027730 [Xylariales sp. No.14919]|nr:hypothetical protein ANO14919_027730 [Xylariales sp. No.14919]